MKKILFLLFMIPFMVSCSSSSDDDNTNNGLSLIGNWVEDSYSTQEVVHMQFNADKTGCYWITTNGVIDKDGKQGFLWNADNITITFCYENSGITSRNNVYVISNSKLYLGSIIYKRQ